MQVFGEDAQRVTKSACFDNADSLQNELLYDPLIEREIYVYVSQSRQPPNWIDSRVVSRTSYRTGIVSSIGGRMRDPGIAAVLSFFIPGIGQIYNGKILRGIFWLIVTPGIWIGTGGLFGWVCHIVSAWTAYRYARRHPVG
jgi:TM2 domain-containing membrane protein YozV